MCPSTSCFFKLPSRLVPLLSTTSFSSISSQLLCSSLSFVLFNSRLVLLLAQSLFVFPTGIHVLRTDVTHAQSAMRVWWRSTNPLRGGQCRAFALKECQAEKHTPFKNNGVQPKCTFAKDLGLDPTVSWRPLTHTSLLPHPSSTHAQSLCGVHLPNIQKALSTLQDSVVSRDEFLFVREETVSLLFSSKPAFQGQRLVVLLSSHQSTSALLAIVRESTLPPNTYNESNSEKKYLYRLNNSQKLKTVPA